MVRNYHKGRLVDIQCIILDNGNVINKARSSKKNQKTLYREKKIKQLHMSIFISVLRNHNLGNDSKFNSTI